jgi:hypothetical protein
MGLEQESRAYIYMSYVPYMYDISHAYREFIKKSMQAPARVFRKKRSEAMPGQSLFLKGAENADRSARIDRFREVRGSGSGRLVFALDATASRKPTWDMARRLTGDMIREAASVGSLSLQLVYFRGGLVGAERMLHLQLDV